MDIESLKKKLSSAYQTINYYRGLFIEMKQERDLLAKQNEELRIRVAYLEEVIKRQK